MRFQCGRMHAIEIASARETTVQCDSIGVISPMRAPTLAVVLKGRNIPRSTYVQLACDRDSGQLEGGSNATEVSLGSRAFWGVLWRVIRNDPNSRLKTVVRRILTLTTSRAPARRQVTRATQAWGARRGHRPQKLPTSPMRQVIQQTPTQRTTVAARLAANDLVLPMVPKGTVPLVNKSVGRMASGDRVR